MCSNLDNHSIKFYFKQLIKTLFGSLCEALQSNRWKSTLQTIYKRLLNCLNLKTDYFLYHFLTLVLHMYLFKLETGQGGSHQFTA